jgi:hypothetical protein
MIGLPVPQHEMIDCESWYHIADYHYTNERTDFPTGIVHVDMGSIPQFFEKIKNSPNKYIVISSRSDFGLHYQRDFPPWKDYVKEAGQLLGEQNTHYGYEDVVLPAPIRRGYCNSNDTYSIKCYRWTYATFDNIPRSVVKWFVTNNTIYDDSRITSIPFGINGTDGNQESKQKIYNKAASIDWNKQRERDLYVNFQFYANERVKLFYLYSDMGLGIVEKDVPFENYLDQLEIHNCNLCPLGNGVDCYRNLESLYMGCIPIMELHPGLMFYLYLDLPIIFVRSLECMTSSTLQNIRNTNYIDDRTSWDLEKITLSYWKNIIEENRELLT